MKKIKLGMIGCGQISDRFFKMAQQLEGVEFVATCAKHLDSAKKKGLEYSVASHFDNYEKMMSEVELDGVVVTTPHSVHAEVCLAAFKHGLNVFNEKPMATTYEDCKAMVAAGESKGVTFMTLPYEMRDVILTAQSLMKEDIIGKITGGEACLNLDGPPRDNWYYDKSIAMGGAMLDCVVYPTSHVASLIGGAKQVTGFVNNLIPKRLVGGGKRVQSDVDDNVSLVLEYPQGQIVNIRTLWGTGCFDFSATIFGREGTIVIYDWMDTRPGRVILQSRSGKCSIPLAKPVEWRGWSGCFEIPLIPQKETMLAHFVRSIREKTEPSCSGRRQLHVHEILFKGYESARDGKVKELETRFEPWHELPETIFDTRSEFI